MGRLAQDLHHLLGHHLPPEVMKRSKAEKANGVPHLVPLARQAVKVLQELKPITGAGRFVFPSLLTGERCMSENTIRGALRRMGYTNDEMTAHGFRATARTMLEERLNFPGAVIEAQLAHKKQGPLGAAYDRTQYLDRRREMMAAWAAYCDRLRDGTEVPAPKEREPILRLVPLQVPLLAPRSAQPALPRGDLTMSPVVPVASVVNVDLPASAEDGAAAKGDVPPFSPPWLSPASRNVVRSLPDWATRRAMLEYLREEYASRAGRRPPADVSVLDQVRWDAMARLRALDDEIALLQPSAVPGSQTYGEDRARRETLATLSAEREAAVRRADAVFRVSYTPGARTDPKQQAADIDERVVVLTSQPESSVQAARDRPDARQKLTAADKDLIARRLAKGHAADSLAREFGVSVSTIRRCRKAAVSATPDRMYSLMTGLVPGANHRR